MTSCQEESFVLKGKVTCEIRMASCKGEGLHAYTKRRLRARKKGLKAKEKNRRRKRNVLRKWKKGFVSGEKASCQDENLRAKLKTLNKNEMLHVKKKWFVPEQKYVLLVGKMEGFVPKW